MHGVSSHMYGPGEASTPLPWHTTRTITSFPFLRSTSPAAALLQGGFRPAAWEQAYLGAKSRELRTRFDLQLGLPLRVAVPLLLTLACAVRLGPRDDGCCVKSLLAIWVNQVRGVVWKSSDI